MQPAGGVDDDDVEAAVLRLGHRAARAAHRVLFARRVVDLDASLLADDRELLDRGRAPHVGRDEQRVTALLGEPPTQLARRRRLARPLEAEQQDHARSGGRLRQPALRVAEERQHLVAHDAHDLLRRRQALEDFLIDGAIAHAIDEGLDDLEVDVRFEQRHADLAQRGLDGLLGEPSLAAKGAEHSLETIAERVKHA